MPDRLSLRIRQHLPPGDPKKAAQFSHLGEDVILMVILLIQGES